jgi:hypothetical protein
MWVPQVPLLLLLLPGGHGVGASAMHALLAAGLLLLA